MTTVIVGGALANKPCNGGEAWVRLSWVLGLRDLGFRVCFVEQLDAAACVDADGLHCPVERSINLAYFQQVIGDFGLSGQAALVYENGAEIFGLERGDLLAVAETAGLLVNISGHLSLEPFLRCRCKAYIDIDPGYTQFWHATGALGNHLQRHDCHFTIGENIGTPACSIPTGGIRWRPIRQPVVLQEWPVVVQESADRFTTVASWRGPYGPVEHGGKTFGLKVHEFRKFVELPQRAAPTFEIALNIHPADHRDLCLLQSHGWHIVSPATAIPNPASFRRYLQGSSAEFSVAQGIYVDTHSGWFSDRTVRYLASGKPALVQETGFSRHYPAGEGLVAFRTLDEAVAGAERIARDYPGHCGAARSLAREYFASEKVLGRFLDEVNVVP